jgi:ferredoxin
VSILTFSLTGNTKLIAKRIAAKLVEAKHHVTLFNLVKIGKEFDSLGPDASPLLTQLRESLRTSDVVGLGAFSNFAHPSWRVNELFSDAALPSGLFKNMKFFFTFATAGQVVWRTLNVLSTLLSDKNPSATFIGSFSALAPENGVPLMALKPYRDTWAVAELARVEEFSSKIAESLNDPQKAVPAKFSRAKSWEFFARRGRLSMRSVQSPVVDREKCQRCGTCERKCPYNAVRCTPDIEDGFPTFDRKKCEGCGRCFNVCPFDAMQIPETHSELRSRYPTANTVPAGQRCADGAISVDFPRGVALNRRMFLGRERVLLLRIAIAVLVIALLIRWIA